MHCQLIMRSDLGVSSQLFLVGVVLGLRVELSWGRTKPSH